VRQPDLIELLVHEDGVLVPELGKTYQNQLVHDPGDLAAARRLAEPGPRLRLGVFFRDQRRPLYEDLRRLPRLTGEEKLARLNQELETYAV
jgi:hypothetical protein